MRPRLHSTPGGCLRPHNAPWADFEGDAIPLDRDAVAGAVADIGADEYNPSNPTGPTMISLTPASVSIGAVGGGTTVTATLDHPAKRDLVLYLTHADTNTDSPGEFLVMLMPPCLKILKGTTGAQVTVQALGAARHGTAQIIASDPSGALADGNSSATVTIETDMVAPTGAILINNGAIATNITAVTLNLTATDAGGSGLRWMRFRNSDQDPYGAWEPYQSTRAWTLTGSAGTRQVFVQYMDWAGNISDGNPVAAGQQGYKDTIIYDSTAPTGAISVNNGAAATNKTAVTLKLTAADTGGSGLVSMRFRGSDTEPYGAWEPYQSTREWILSDGAGIKLVYVQFVDGAGNISDANPTAAGPQGYKDSIVLKP